MLEKGWNAIDLHMHTFVGIDGRGENDIVNFTYQIFEEKIRYYKLKLISPLGHNKIDLINLLLCKYICKINNCNVLPSVELDLKIETIDDLHCIFIFNASLKEMMQLEKMIKKEVDEGKLKKCIRFDSDRVIEILNTYDVIMIPHGDKDRGYFQDATEENIKNALIKVKEGFIHAFDSFGMSKWKLVKVKSFINSNEYKDLVDDFKGVMFSDVHNWNDYDKRFHNFYMNAEPTYRGLLHSISGAENRFSVKNHIPKKSNYISKIVLTGSNSRKKIESTTLHLSPGYNCIIGNSGSGKSLLIHLIKRTLNYDYNQKDDYKDYASTKVELYDENCRLITQNKMSIQTGDSLFKWIIGDDINNETAISFAKKIKNSFTPRCLLDSRINNFKSDVTIFVGLLKRNDKLKNDVTELFAKLLQDTMQYNKLKEIKSFDIDGITPIEKKYEFITDELVNNDIKYLDEIEENLSGYDGKYKATFIECLNKLKKVCNLIYLDINSIKANIDVLQKKYTLVTDILNSINQMISTNSNVKAKLKNSIPQLIEELSLIILELYKNNKKIDNQNIRFDDSNLKKINTKLNNRNISIEERFENSQVKKYDYKSELIFKLYGKKGKLNSRKTYFDLTNSNECKELIRLYYEAGVFDGKEILWKDNSSIITKSVIMFDGQNVEELNPGSIAKKNVEMYFEDEIQKNNPQIVIFDQIENDVDKTFISTTIREEIQKTKDKAQLLIITHDPIVAVNADPTNYIECRKEKGKIIYRNFVPESNERDELKTIADIVDGSKKVIRKRYQIYERENDYDNKN